jgi:hypothetical protein
MKKKQMVFVIALGLTLLTSCVGDNYPFSSTYSSTDSSTSPLDSTYLNLPTDVGLEAYCWRENGEWRSGLMSGTDRTKTTAEIDGLKGISLAEMKQVLRTYDPQTTVIPFWVSRPAQERLPSSAEGTTGMSEKITAFLADQLGLADHRISTVESLPSYYLSTDTTTRFYATKDFSGFYAADSWVEVSAGILTDVDLDLYLDGVLTSRSYQFQGEKIWTYFFRMPAHATTLSFKVYSANYTYFSDAYPWAQNLVESQIDKIEAVSCNYDIGPGGMKSFYHGDSSADKQAFLAYVEDNLLREDRSASQISGGLPWSFTITISGTAHTFVLNGKALDGKYISARFLAKPSSFDYSSFIPYNGIYLWDKDDQYGRIISDASFFADVHFQPYTPSDIPELTGYHFAMGPGIYFIDAKHFKYGSDYYVIVSTADFGAYING